MCANKTDKHCPDVKKYHCYQSVFISFDIEYVSVIPNVIDSIKRFF